MSSSALMKKLPGGQVSCVLCGGTINPKSWTAHIRGRQHFEAIQRHKSRLNNIEVKPPEKDSRKRTLEKEPPLQVQKQPKLVEIQNQEQSVLLESGVKGPRKVENETKVPATSKPVLDNEGFAIPEGFFDDPKIDKKIRGIDEKAQMEDEWQRFKKEMQQTEQEISTQITEEEDAEVISRSLEEAQEQIVEWKRVNQLQQMKDDVMTEPSPTLVEVTLENPLKPSPTAQNFDFSNIDEIDELLNWRNL